MQIHPLTNLSSKSSCSIRLETLVAKINVVVSNSKNASIISDFHKYMQLRALSENHQVNNLKVVIDFAKFLGPLSFYEVKKRDQILSLAKKMKPAEDDPERRSITTWNHYLNIIKLFFRWLCNYHSRENESTIQDNDEWITPEFCKIKAKQTKRLSPYSENEIWERDELLTLVKHEPSIRNKTILSISDVGP
jgi:hypothetical protein